ncbi:MAG: HAMP domain-containing sensor histidine kinase [Deltaproteobacteria bacterium]|nr:HAMP domain-containing sensor histidine kinase [Deltaproteobacteria bacterium]
MTAAPLEASAAERTQTAISLPPRRRSLGLRIQVLLGLAVVALFAVISTGALSLWAAADGLREQRESTVNAIASAAASAISSALPAQTLSRDFAVVERLQPILSQLLEGSGLVEVSVMDANKRVVASRPLRDPADIDPPAALATLSGVPSILHYRKSGAGQTELLAYAPVTSGKRVIGIVRVVLLAPPPMIGFLAKSGTILVGLALGNAVLLVALGYLLITSLVVRPLRAVEQATAGVGNQTITAITIEGPREIESLAASFNRMTASLASQREQLIRTEKLASVGQLAAGVAHEIGNPLAAILGYADILRDDAAEPAAQVLSEAERLNISERIKSETQRIHRTISDLLEYSRPSRDEARPTDLLVVVKAARDLVAPMGSRLRGATVVIEGVDDPERWPHVVAAPERLKQVLVNLLLNAADAMPNEGTITISASAALPERVELRVSDTGPGVPPELRRRIFDPFFTTKEPGKGTGLGLSISRSIVETFGGTLELQAPSAEIGGATFVVSLLAAHSAGPT